MRWLRLSGASVVGFALRRAREEWKKRERKFWEKYGARLGAFVGAVEKKCALSCWREAREEDVNVRTAALLATAAVLGAEVRRYATKEAIL